VGVGSCNHNLSKPQCTVPLPQAKDSWEMDAGEKLAAAALQKDKGNTAFKAGQYARAVQRYNKATEIIE
jgi:hypothetical protein